MKDDLFLNLVKKNFIENIENSGIKIDKELASYLIPALLIYLEDACKKALITVAKIKNIDINASKTVLNIENKES